MNPEAKDTESGYLQPQYPLPRDLTAVSLWPPPARSSGLQHPIWKRGSRSLPGGPPSGPENLKHGFPSRGVGSLILEKETVFPQRPLSTEKLWCVTGGPSFASLRASHARNKSRGLKEDPKLQRDKVAQGRRVGAGSLLCPERRAGRPARARDITVNS